jgi:hypothetical protein
VTEPTLIIERSVALDALAAAERQRAPSFAPRRPRSELVSPFVAYGPEDRGEIPERMIEAAEDRSLVGDLLRDPGAVVERILDPARAERTILGSLAAIAGSAALYALVVKGGAGLPEAARAAGLVPASMLLALAAVLGPVWATGLMIAARLPLARLVGTLTAAVATGALLLVPLAPLTRVALELNPAWAGPLSICASFGTVAAAAGGRVRGLLLRLALQVARDASPAVTIELTPHDAFRVGILARMAMVLIAFTQALAFWSFDSLG